MKRWILLPVLLSLLCCKREEKNNSYLSPEKALHYFEIIEDICIADNGKLWGKNLFGPVLFVDRVTRDITANQPDNEGILKEKDGVFIGTYPKELIINNFPVKIGGMLFAMVPLPDEEDDYRIKTSAIHSLFHRYQEEIGITLLLITQIIWMRGKQDSGLNLSGKHFGKPLIQMERNGRLQ